MNKICLGCGVVLQSDNQEKEGYTPDIKNDYCRRCFRLKNYGEKIKEEVISNEVITNKINKQKGIVFFLIDFLNINRETINIFKKIKLNKVLIISKCDLLRKDMKFNILKKWLKKEYRIREDIFFNSGKKNYTELNILKYMEKNNYKNGFIMGITNAGKSTFMNNLLKNEGINKEVVTSKYQNTTLDFIKFKIGDFFIYDTPGFGYDTLDSTLLETEIKPISYNIVKPVLITINDKYQFYFKEPNKIVLYVIGKVKKEFREIKGNNISVKDNEDIILKGIGFINIKKAGSIISNLEDAETRNDYSGVNYE